MTWIVYGGSGSNTYNVDAATGGTGTQLNTGGKDTVNVTDCNGGLTINATAQP